MKQPILFKQLLCSACIVIGLLSASLVGNLFQEQVTMSETQVITVLQKPSSTPSTPNNYTISTIDENRVESIDVLAFRANTSKPSGWVFDNQAESTTITDTSVRNCLNCIGNLIGS